MEDILFDYHPPAIGQPNADEDEVLHALPPYPNCQQSLVGAAQADYPIGVMPNLRNRPFGLPMGIQREPEGPEFKFKSQTLRYMLPSVQPYIPRSKSAIWVINDKVAEHLDATSLPLCHLQ